MNHVSTEVVGKIKAAVNASRHAKGLFDYLATYERDRRVTFVDNLARGAGLSEYEVREVLKEIEDLGLGELRIGRRGHRTRFEWDVSLRKVAAIGLDRDAGASDVDVLEDAEWLQEAEDSDGDDEQLNAGNGKTTHRFRVRRDFEAQLVLPYDLTSKDVERITAFLNTLPVD